MHWNRRGFLAAIGAAAPSLAWADEDRQPLWELRSGTGKVFLFGDGNSLTTPWRSPRIETAFAASAVFWKETPDPAPGDTAKYLARGRDPARPLSTWLTADEKARTTAAAVGAGATYEFLEPFEPWLAAGLLGMAYARHQSPAPSPLPVLGAEAKAQGKPVRTEFPDVDALIAWAAGMSPTAQVEYLMYTIETSQDGPDQMGRRTSAWARADFSLETERVLHLAKAYPELYVPLVLGRNRGWPPRIRAMLDGGATSFVLMGADHLVGPDSVLVQLAAAGMRALRV